MAYCTMYIAPVVKMFIFNIVTYVNKSSCWFISMIRFFISPQRTPLCATKIHTFLEQRVPHGFVSAAVESLAAALRVAGSIPARS